MTRRCALTLLVATIAAIWPWLADAQTPSPGVTVLTFKSEGRTGLSEKERGEVADLLAAHLADSGRYRVMDRAWLQGMSGDRVAAPEARRIAMDADVEYVVTGIIRKSSRRMRTLAPMQGRPRAGQRRGPLGALWASRPVMVRQTFLIISVEMTDVRTGEMAAQKSVELPAPTGSRAASVASMIGLLSGSPARALTGVAAVRAVNNLRSSSPLDHAMTEVSQALVAAASRLSGN